jgi:hypothetical protein
VCRSFLLLTEQAVENQHAPYSRARLCPLIAAIRRRGLSPLRLRRLSLPRGGGATPDGWCDARAAAHAYAKVPGKLPIKKEETRQPSGIGV